MTTLPVPKIVEYDPAIVEADVIADFEARIGQGISPGQPEWFLLQTWAYREALIRLALNEAAKQNLLAFAQYPIIDYLGRLVGVERLEAQFATTTLEWSIPEALGVDVVIPAGTRRKSKNGVAVFATDKQVIIVSGETSVTVTATATTAGTHANGYLAGQISEVFDDVPGAIAVNLAKTGGGAPQETSERLLERILLAPDARSTAGGEAGYRYHALSASQAIEDVAILTPAPLQIRVVILDDDGTATPELQALVLAKLTPSEVRPQGDQVTAEASDVVDFAIDAGLTLYKNTDPTVVLAAAQEAAVAFQKSRRKLGRSALREQVRARLTVRGVHSVALAEPATDVVPEGDSWARCTTITVVVSGYSDEEAPDE